MRPPRDPIPALLAVDHPGLDLFVHRDLLGEVVDPESLWADPVVAALARRQRADGAWIYTGRRSRPSTAYDLLSTYEALLVLVEQYALDARHPAFRSAAEFVLGFQRPAGDLRGMYGNQYSPNYTAAIVAVLLD